MINLNYNIIGAQGPRNVEGFQPFFREDPFAQYIVCAIPGATFSNNYQPQFGATEPWQDISGYIRGDYTNLSGSLTGSGTFSNVADVNKFTDNGYSSSLFISPEIAVVFQNSLTPKEGFNLTTGSLQSGSYVSGTKGRSSVGFVVEAWVALPTASAFGQYYKELSFQPYETGAPSLGQQWMSVNWNGNVKDPAGPPAPDINVSGSIRFVVNDGTEIRVEPSDSGSRSLGAFEWHHFAVAGEAPWTQPGLFPDEKAKVRTFIDGQLVGYKEIDSEYRQSTGSIMQILGHVGNDSVGNPWEEVPAYVQDFRFYNGTNKNYTSSFTPPESMVIGKATGNF